MYVRLDGTLSQPQREKAIKDFTDRPDVGVMLISLKAGGVGINLTAASNAFLLVRNASVSQPVSCSWASPETALFS